MKRVTVKDIAKASGYSVATVSKTLNGTDRVGAETIEKIKRIAAEMGYRSSFSAQALVRKTRRVAIVLFRSPPEVRHLFEKGFDQSFDLYSEFGLEADYTLFDRMADVDWDAIEQNLTFGGIVQTAEQLNESRFTTAILTDHRQFLAYTKLGGHMTQSPAITAGVLETYITKFDLVAVVAALFHREAAFVHDAGDVEEIQRLL